MQMRFTAFSLRTGGKQTRSAAFSLVEVVISLAILGITFAGLVYGYAMSSGRAEWSAYSLAAQSLAMQGLEQARAARWAPQDWPPVDELGTTNLTQAEVLDLPAGGGAPVLATNYISITSVSSDPPLRQLRVDCVWMLKGSPSKHYGPFTNTVISFRAADK
jgi:type II secretory pathway pseudopilin PulG